MNLVESFFAIVTRPAIRRASFTSVRHVTAAIRISIDGWNERRVPLEWTEPAYEILAKANRQPDSKNLDATVEGWTTNERSWPRDAMRSEASG